MQITNPVEYYLLDFIVFNNHLNHNIVQFNYITH